MKEADRKQTAEQLNNEKMASKDKQGTEIVEYCPNLRQYVYYFKTSASGTVINNPILFVFVVALNFL